MFEIECLEELIPSDDVIDIISNSNPNNIKIINGKVNLVKRTNIKTIEPIVYELTYKKDVITIWQYPIEEIKGNNFYMPNNKNIYSLLEIKTMLRNY